MKSTHHGVEELADIGQYAHPYLYTKTDGSSMDDVKKIDKVKIAHEVTSKPAELDILDLRERIEDLVRFIRSANHEEQ